jgi:uncharacterized RDD family membrane protein YckC
VLPGTPLQLAGLGRRLASLLYEVPLVAALAFLAAFAFHGSASNDLQGLARHVFQLYLALVIGLYFVWCWLRGGQTLPMKTWRLKLVRADGTALSPARAVARYVLCWASLGAAGAGFAWALVDKDRQFLHDRLAGTRIVRA